jgi:peptidoglycan/LPS O-acetylase OafA/YrhL
VQAYPATLLFAVEFIPTGCWTLGHTWSLSVEEFFYVVSVAAVWIFNRDAFRKFIFVCIAIGPLARTFNYMCTAKHDMFSFLPIVWLPFLPRLDVLAIGAFGACLACLGFAHRERLLKHLSGKVLLVLAAVGYLTDVNYLPIPYVGFLRYVMWPFGMTITGIVALAIVLVAIYKGPTTGCHKLLSFKPLVFLGKISYSLYLWQQIFLVPNESWLGPDWRFTDMFLRIGCAILVGTVSFYCFEDPLMKALRRWMRLEPSHFSTAPAATSTPPLAA